MSDDHPASPVPLVPIQAPHQELELLVRGGTDAVAPNDDSGGVGGANSSSNSNRNSNSNSDGGAAQMVQLEGGEANPKTATKNNDDSNDDGVNDNDNDNENGLLVLQVQAVVLRPSLASLQHQQMDRMRRQRQQQESNSVPRRLRNCVLRFFLWRVGIPIVVLIVYYGAMVVYSNLQNMWTAISSSPSP